MKSSTIVLGGIAAGLLIAACGGAGGDASSGGGHASGTGTTTGHGGATSGHGGAGGGTGGGLLGGCQPPCAAPQLCSATKTCIDPGTCASDGDCDVGTVCDPAKKICVPGGACGAQEVVAKAIPPNLLVVLDRSCSMTDVVVNSKTKWDVAVAALNKLTVDYAAKIRFGLTLFPDLVTPNCAQAAIPIPVNDGNEAAMQALLTASLKAADKYFPDGPCVTNIDTAMQQAATEPAFGDVGRQSYALLITDGKQAGCNAAGGDPGTTGIITDLFQKKKVATFVIGFGSGIDPAQMNTFADAGGVPNSDPVTRYYKAEDQASLDAALAAIASKTLSCTFSLASKPPAADQLFVFFDNDPAGVKKDPAHADGWDYDSAANAVTFYGHSCDLLKTGAVTDVDIVFGCNMPTPN